MLSKIVVCITSIIIKISIAVVVNLCNDAKSKIASMYLVLDSLITRPILSASDLSLMNVSSTAPTVPARSKSSAKSRIWTESLEFC